MKSVFNINGITISGNNIDIVGGRVIIDGVEQKGEKLAGVVEIRVLEGTINHLTTDASVTCGNVTGNVKAKMSVHCDNVNGNVDAGMSVHCDDVGGSVDAGMSVYRS